MLRTLRYIVWILLALFTDPRVIVGCFVPIAFAYPEVFWPICISWILAATALKPITGWVRPPELIHRNVPARERPVIAAIARIAVRIKGRALNPAKIHKRLSPELRALLRKPANQLPASLAFEQRVQGREQAVTPSTNTGAKTNA